VYVIFTFVYYFTGGIVEEFLIGSRAAGVSELLAQSGRGARTLSPEPSIMAVHILNIILLNCLTFKNTEIGSKILLLALIPLFGSLSGYGFFIAFSLLLIFYPSVFIGILVILLLSLSTFNFNFDFNGMRASVIIEGMRENGIGFLLQDGSFNSRFYSFLEYKDAFVHAFPFGEAFTIFGGGGIVSLISALGLVGLLFFLGVFALLLFSHYSIRLKALFSVWLTVYFISGSFAVPLFGLILGVFVTNSFKHEKNIDTTSCL